MKNLRFLQILSLCAVLTGWLSVTAIPIPAPKASIIHTNSKSLAAMKFKNVEFAFNKAEVPVTSYKTLDKVAKLMVENDAALRLGGYADNRGGYVYNWKLSKARAEAVKDYLVKKGADKIRIAATEYGYTQPIASNNTKLGRQKNRRVEVKFTE